MVDFEFDSININRLKRSADQPETGETKFLLPLSLTPSSSRSTAFGSSKMANDIGRSFRMRIALQAVRIQYRDSVRRLVFSPYNKFCNPLSYVTF